MRRALAGALHPACTFRAHRSTRWAASPPPDAPELAPAPGGRFAVAPLVQSARREARLPLPLASVEGAAGAGEVRVRARLQNVRLRGKLAFLILRDGRDTLQGVLAASEAAGVTKETLKWVASLPAESVVDVWGQVAATKAEVASCTVRAAELRVTGVHVVSPSAPVLPFQILDASAPELQADGEIHVQQHTRLNHRWLDMRTRANQAIWRLQSKVCQHFRDFVAAEGFVEIHTPKIIPAASEGGASVFKLKYFERDAYLAQSPQLYKQMCLMGDLKRVFEVGPVFRAEDSNTHRHLCEFTGLDVEMAIDEHYHEVLDFAEGLLHSIFRELQAGSAELINDVRSQHRLPDDLAFRVADDVAERLGLGVGLKKGSDEFGAVVGNEATKSLRLEYKDAVRLLNTALAEGERLAPTDDVSTAQEKLLGRLVKERYGVDFYIVEKFPLAIRPFYTMPCPHDGRFANSYDIFIRGEEVSSGAQRIHDAALLDRRCRERGANPDDLAAYIDSFRHGGWPHGGFGLGLERVVMLFLGLPNVRSCSAFPRDPKRVTP